MVKYTWNNNGKKYAHCFSNDGFYIGFQPDKEKIQPDYSEMVKGWVENKKTEEELKPLMDKMGFTREYHD